MRSLRSVLQSATLLALSVPAHAHNATEFEKGAGFGDFWFRGMMAGLVLATLFVAGAYIMVASYRAWAENGTISGNSLMFIAARVVFLITLTVYFVR